MAHTNFIITDEEIKQYIIYLRNEEKADNTLEKYERDIRAFWSFADGKPVTKETAIEWKVKLKDTHAVTSINSMLAAINGFFAFFKIGIKVKPYKIQQQAFLPDKKDLSKEEYERLLKAANTAKNERLFYIMQTLCSIGIRVSELRHITVESVKLGQAVITNKGKTRTVFIPDDLRKSLLQYAKNHNISSQYIFITRKGTPLNRSDIWAQMKKLCTVAEVDPAKVFPHNLRGLFARIFYSIDRDIIKVTNVLGHSSVNTARLYVMENSIKHRKIVENLGLSRLKYEYFT